MITLKDLIWWCFDRSVTILDIEYIRDKFDEMVRYDIEYKLNKTRNTSIKK